MQTRRQSGKGKRRAARRVWGAAIAAVVLLCPGRLCAQQEREAEYKVKLAFLYHFAQFIEWPSSSFHDAQSPLVICIAGHDPFKGGIEQALHGRTAGGHPVTLKVLSAGEDSRTCQMMFVPAAASRELPRVLAPLKGSSVLTVGEAKGFVSHGGMINLVVEDNKVRFEVNLEAAQRSGLRISSKVLALARIVTPERAP